MKSLFAAVSSRSRCQQARNTWESQEHWKLHNSKQHKTGSQPSLQTEFASWKFTFRRCLEQRKSGWLSSRGKESYMRVWNEGTRTNLSGGTASKVVFLEEWKNELRTKGNFPTVLVATLSSLANLYFIYALLWFLCFSFLRSKHLSRLFPVFFCSSVLPFHSYLFPVPNRP